MIPARAGAILLVVLVTLLGACSDDGDDDTVARALAQDLLVADALAGRIDADEARCVGDEVVAALGADAAGTLGRDRPDDAFDLARLTTDEVAAVGAAMEGCIDDLAEIVAEVVAAQTEDPRGELPIDAGSATCIGESVADEIGFTRLLAIRAEAAAQDTDELAQLTDDEAEVFATAYTDCLDVRQLVLDGVRESGADEAVVACLDERISDEDLEERFVALFAGDETGAADAFAGAIDACT